MLVAEFVGPLFLVLIGCSSCVEGWQNYQPQMVQIGICFGITIATMAQVNHGRHAMVQSPWFKLLFSGSR